MNKKVLVLLGSGHGIIDMSQGALPMMLAILKPVFAMTQMQVGLVMLAFNLSSSVIQPLFGVYSDRIRATWLLPLGCLLAGLGMAATGFSTSYPMLLLAALVCGLGVAAYHPEASKFARRASGEKKASGMALFSVGGNFGFAAGPVLANLLYGLSGSKGTTGFLVLNGLMAVLILTNLSLVAPPEIATTNNGQLRSVQVKAKNVGGFSQAGQGIRFFLPVILLVLVVIIRSWVHLGLVTFLPQYYVNYLHHSKLWASSITSLYLLAGAFGTIVGGPAADRWGLKTIIICSFGLMIPLLYLIGASSGLLATVATIMAGFVVISTFALTVVLGQELLPNNVGLASGLTLGFGIGMGGVGTTLLGWVADSWGLPVVFHVMTIFPLFGLLLAFFLPGSAAIERRKNLICASVSKS